jgi:alpha-glucosidase
VLAGAGATLLAGPAWAKGDGHEIVSPDGRLRLRLGLGAKGPVWSVTRAGKPILAASPLGLVTADDQRLGPGARVAGISRRREGGDWVPPYGIRRRYDQTCSELTVEFVQPDTGVRFAVVARAYDHGCAVRYVLRHAPGGALKLKGEATGFVLPPRTFVYASRDEGEYYRTAPADVGPAPHPALTASSDKETMADLPVTALVHGAAVLIAESDRLDYPRAMLRAQGGTLVTHMMRYPARADGYSGPGETPPEDSFDFAVGQASPWRVLVVADNEAGLVERADLITALASPNRLGDVSWIKPGRAVRVRKPYGMAGTMDVIAFAAARKLDYIEFDAHWYGDGTDPSDATQAIPALDMPAIVAAARAKGLGVILYVDRVPVMRQRDAILATYKAWGVAGIKFGFVWEGRQSDNRFIADLVRACGEHHLLVNLHDNLRPAGLERTYPNYVALEGVRGNEQFPTARHNVTLPFTRAVAGPIDYTICYAHARNQTTNAHQLAMAAVYYNPLTFLYWYDAPEKYAGKPWPELAWFDECPTTWDETRALAGKIGEYVVVARRSGDRWFLGAMTNETPRVLKIPLDFLGKGTRRARVFADGEAGAQANQTPVMVSESRVDGTGILTLDLKPSGGQAVLFEAAETGA